MMSPGLRKFPVGSATPEGVPVEMISPGVSVIRWLRNETVCGME